MGMCPCPPSCPHHVSTRVPPSGVNKGRCYCDRERQVSPSGCVFTVPQPPQSQVHGPQLQVRRPRPPSSGNRSGKLPLTPHGKWAPVCSGEGHGHVGHPPCTLPLPCGSGLSPPPPTSICGEIARRGPAGSQGSQTAVSQGLLSFHVTAETPPWGRKHGAYVSCLETPRSLPLCLPHPLHLVLLRPQGPRLTNTDSLVWSAAPTSGAR